MLSKRNSFAGSNGWVCCACRSLRGSVQSRGRGFASQPADRKSRQKLPAKPARTRFAPSPTGLLHLGSLRTALFNYLLARATGGQFLLRIEDTDTKRTVPGAEDRICRDLEWAGLQWDEGPEVGGPFGPYRQSERTAIYQTHVQQLLESGHAYRCFCSAQRLDELARMRSKLGLPTDYDRTCHGITKEESDEKASKGHSHVIRLKVPDVYPRYDDLIYGRVGGARPPKKIVTHAQQSFEDPVLLKSDGLPTYHLANVVDDHLMKVTHVVRAVEWMPSTPKHVYMYEAFGWQAPAYAHVGLLLDQQGQKLSKRHHNTGIDSYRESGIFPEALDNFVALLGWSHSLGSDKLGPAQLISNFDLKFTKGNTVVSFQKLNFLQRLYSEAYAEADGSELDLMVQRASDVVKKQENFQLPAGQKLPDYVRAILKADAKSYTPLTDFFERHKSFFQFDLQHDGMENRRSEYASFVVEVYWKLQDVSPSEWTKEKIHDQLDQAILTVKSTDMEAKEGTTLSGTKRTPKDLMSELRKIIMASRPGPPMADCMQILGRESTLERLSRAVPSSSTVQQTPSPEYASNAA